jgi:hypothetical protein
MPDPVTGVTVGATLLGSSMQADAAESAAEAQAGSARAGIDEQRRQFDFIQNLLKPYTEAGVPALQAQQAFLGLRGPEEERAAIERISGGQRFQELTRQGEEALLQRASATGGLRGGNVQAALAQFRPQVLNQLIEEQYGRLGGMTTLGQRSAAGVGDIGFKTGENVATLMGQEGAAMARGDIAQAKAYAPIFNLPGQFMGGSRGGFGSSYGGGQSGMYSDPTMIPMQPGGGF